MLEDFRYAVRTLTRNRGFAAIAILTFALGIGANAVIFSVVDGVVLKPLPFTAPERLVQVTETNLARDVSFFSVSVPNYLD
jgi:putative ABC transport system permease protein